MENIIKKIIKEFERDFDCEDWVSEEYTRENWRICGTEHFFNAMCEMAGVSPRKTRGSVQYAMGEGFSLRHYDDGDRIVLSVFCG